MPRYKLQGPDGRTVTIEAADRDTAIRGAQEWASANPVAQRPVNQAEQAALDYTRRIAGVSQMAADRPARAPTERPVRGRQRAPTRAQALVEDSQKSVNSGLLQGLAGTADMMAFSSPTPMGSMLTAMGLAPSQLLESSGLNYVPQTTEGEYAQTIASMAPAAASPGSAMTRAAAVVVPGITSETAGQMARAAGLDEGSEAFWRFVGALTGGAATGLRASRPGTQRPGPPRLNRQEQAALRRVTRGVDPQAARQRVADIRQYGGAPVMADAIGSRGQARVRAAATRDIPEQQVAVDFGDARRVNSQAFTSRLGERVSPETRSPVATRAAIEDARNAQATGDYAGPYQTVISVDRGNVANPTHDLPPNVRSVLEDGVGRGAVNRALEAELIDQNQAMIRQLRALADGDKSVPITAEALDRVRIAFREMGNDAKAAFKGKASRAFFGRVNQLDTILDDVPELRSARAAYREQSLQADAVDAGDRLFAPRGVREDVEAAAGMTPAQRQAARAGQRNAIEERAGKPSTAAGALDELALGETVNARLNAFGGPDLAADVRRGAGVGRGMLETGRNVSPRVGSATNLNQENSGALNGVGAIGEAALAVKTGGITALFRPIVNTLKRVGLSDADAGRMVQIALDPDPRKLEAALQYLEGSSPQLARVVRVELARIAARGAPVAAISAATSARAQERPGPPRR